MHNPVLYNGKRFPEYVFDRRDVSYVFIEFDAVFDNAFLLGLENFLNNYKLQSVQVKNVEPELFEFNVEIPAVDFARSFKAVATTEKPQSYISVPASFYMLTEHALVYTNDNKQPFCIVLDRRYWIAIIGVANVSALHYFARFSIGDVLDYLSANFRNDVIADSFRSKLIDNWY